MNKNYIIDNKRHTILISCGPERVIESEEWFPTYFNKSINDYLRIITGYLHYLKEKTFLLSYYDPCRELNLVEKKKGMAGVFQRLKQEYYSDAEKIIERDWMEIILSVAEFTEANNKILFNIMQPRSILCVGKNITSENILTFEIEKGLDVFQKNFFQYGSAIIQYNDVACDGNNIKFTFNNNFLGIEKLIELLTSNGYVAIEDEQ